MSKSYKKHLETTPNFKPIVYICAPYRGDKEKNGNMLFGVRLTRICAEQSPLLHTCFSRLWMMRIKSIEGMRCLWTLSS